MSSTISKGYREGYRPLTEKDIRAIEEYESQTGCPIGESDERSAGCIVFTHDTDGRLSVLQVSNDTNGEIWYSFPKGHLDEGEDDITAAIRETSEETGIIVSASSDRVILDDQVQVKYSFVTKLHSDKWKQHPTYPDASQRPLVIAHKALIYFVAYVRDGISQVPKAQESELHGAKWEHLDKAMDLLPPQIKIQFERALDIGRRHMPEIFDV
jgi:8-oxo-dGTP pyrophosphatase MutT (NUDIX family)